VLFNYCPFFVFLQKAFNSVSAKTFERTLGFYGLTLRRYQIALSYSKGKKVLDIGSGLGQGPNFLALNGAKSVLAVDYSRKATDLARENFSQPNLEFKTLNGLEIGSLKEKFDLVVAFELIEHLPKGSYQKFLKAVSEVLRKNGVFLMSTPNKLVTSPRRKKPLMAYHVREFTPEEITKMAKKYFKEVEVKGLICRNEPFEQERKKVMASYRHKLAVLLKRSRLVCEILAFLPNGFKRRLTGEAKLEKLIPKESEFDYTVVKVNKRENLLIIASQPKN